MNWSAGHIVTSRFARHETTSALYTRNNECDIGSKMIFY